MHKLKKGLKKKIKGKDHHHKDKGEDLFAPEQLAKFKKELDAQKELEAQQHQQQQSPDGDGEGGDFSEGHHHNTPHSSSSTSTSAVVVDQGDEEWQRFKLLTAGVDSILKKTSGDLDRIKESSYFQRNKPKPTESATAPKSGPQRPSAPPHPNSQNQQHQQQHPEVQGAHGGGPRWVDCDKAAGEEDEYDYAQAEHEQEYHQEEAEPEVVEVEPKVPEEPQEEEPIVLGDELFDTSFLDAIASGEIKLAYIPDSPTEEPGDDPFDTSSADAVVKVIEEEAKKEKKRVNLGVAVDFLTGAAKSEAEVKSAAKKAQQAAAAKKKSRNRPQTINLLGSFDETGLQDQQQQEGDFSVEVQQAPAHDVFDDLSPTHEHSGVQSSSELILQAQLAPTPSPLHFAASPTVESQSSTTNTNLKDLLSEFETFESPTTAAAAADSLFHSSNAAEDPDSFLDDEFADLAAESLHKGDHSNSKPARPGPPVRPAAPTKVKQTLEECIDSAEAESEPDPFDTSFVAGVSDHPDNHIVFGDDPLHSSDKSDNKCQEEEIKVDYSDPFDTSAVHQPPPGKFELKLLEEELLTTSGPTANQKAVQELEAAEEDDFDFDPRKDEKAPEPEPEIHPFDAVAEHESDHAVVESLKPKTQEDFEEVEIDPFDTSAVTVSIAGKIELKILEDEFLVPQQQQPQIQTQPPPKDDFDFDDFDPRQGEPEPAPVPVLIERTVEDIFDSHHHTAEQPLTPFTPAQISAQGQSARAVVTAEEDPDIDPFDTSCVPGDDFVDKAELRNLEAELLHSTTDYQPKRPPLPTSLINPITVSAPPPPIPTEDPPPPPDTFEFEFGSPEGQGHITPLKPQTPSQFGVFGDKPYSFAPNAASVDPFDTRIASSIVPGKIEIQLLESELGVQAGLSRTYSDDDFNPRESFHPSVGLTHLPLLPQTTANVASSEIAKAEASAAASADCFDTSAVEDVDPFDTSVVDNLLLGKSEFKLLEAELL